MNSAITDLQKWRELRRKELDIELSALDRDRPEFSGDGMDTLYSASVLDHLDEILDVEPYQYRRANQEKVSMISIFCYVQIKQIN